MRSPFSVTTGSIINKMLRFEKPRGIIHLYHNKHELVWIKLAAWQSNPAPGGAA
jgi:hypothetical protein